MWSTLPYFLLVLLCAAMPDFRCPELEQTTLCACSEMVWWNNENKTVVDCSSASLHAVPNLGLVTSTQITKILLSGNNISKVTLEDFKNVFVHELDLSRNSLSRMEKESIVHLTNVLTHLNLKSNRIEVNKGLSFIEGFETLVELILDSNVVGYDLNDSATLPDNIFKNLGLRSLKFLSLKSCGINIIESNAFMGLASLETLDLTYNYLEEIPPAILTLRNLKRLVLGGNSIFAIRSDTFAHMKLEEIILDYNDISTIEPAAFNGLENTLKKLEIHSNYLSEIPSVSLRNLRKLSLLKISKNNIHRIARDAFSGLHGLKMLELDSNYIQFNNESFASLGNSLDTLLIRDTGLRYLPVNELLTLRKLQTLDASFNAIGPILDSPVGALNLKTLILTNNNISSVKVSTFENLKQPIELDLDYNAMSDVSFVLRAQPCSFSYVDVIGNPLPCSCDIEYALNSGIMFGIGLTGHCTNIHGRRYELGSSSLTRTLDALCNRTDRVYWCQKFHRSANTSATITNLQFCLLGLSFIFLSVFS